MTPRASTVQGGFESSTQQLYKPNQPALEMLKSMPVDDSAVPGELTGSWILFMSSRRYSTGLASNSLRGVSRLFPPKRHS
jgi:hypothetical protein